MLRIERHTVPFPRKCPKVVMRIRGLRQMLSIGSRGTDVVLWAIVEDEDGKAENVGLWVFKEQACLLEEHYDHNNLQYWNTVKISFTQIECARIIERQSVVHVFYEAKHVWLWEGKDVANDVLKTLCT